MSRTKRSGYSMCEVMVVIAIVTVISSMLLPAVGKSRESANRLKCAVNMQQLALACHQFENTFGTLPPNRLHKQGGCSWAVLLLPFLEQSNLYRQWDTSNCYYVHPDAVRQTVLSSFLCPSRRAGITISISGDKPDTTANGLLAHYAGALGDYAACVGDDIAPDYFGTGGSGALIVANFTGTFSPGPAIKITSWSSKTTFKDISDGTSNVLLCGEKHIPQGDHGLNDPLGNTAGDGSIYNGDHPWVIARAAGPNALLAQKPTDGFNRQFGSAHSGVCQFAFCDGSVRAIPNKTDGATLRLLAIRNDGAITPSFDTVIGGITPPTAPPPPPPTSPPTPFVPTPTDLNRELGVRPDIRTGTDDFRLDLSEDVSTAPNETEK